MWQKAEIWVSAKVHENGVRVGEDRLEEHLRAGFEPFHIVSTYFGVTWYLKRQWDTVNPPGDGLGWPVYVYT